MSTIRTHPEHSKVHPPRHIPSLSLQAIARSQHETKLLGNLVDIVWLVQFILYIHRYYSIYESYYFIYFLYFLVKHFPVLGRGQLSKSFDAISSYSGGFPGVYLVAIFQHIHRDFPCVREFHYEWGPYDLEHWGYYLLRCAYSTGLTLENIVSGGDIMVIDFWVIVFVVAKP